MTILQMRDYEPLRRDRMAPLRPALIVRLPVTREGREMLRRAVLEELRRAARRS